MCTESGEATPAHVVTGVEIVIGIHRFIVVFAGVSKKCEICCGTPSRRPTIRAVLRS
jgi:hypothetical protein